MKGRIKHIPIGQDGFGFIRPADPNLKDVFFRHDVLQQTKFKELFVGQAVEYTAEETERGTRATAVWPATTEAK